jgi:hypothetical protein
VLGTAGPAPVPMEPRDRFRRGRWERGRAYRRPSRFGDSSESIRPFPAPANPTVEPEIVDAATSVTEPLAPQQSASSEPVVDEGLEVAAGSPPAASVEPAPPPADSVQAASEPSLPSTEEGSATSPPKPQPGRSRQGRRPQRSQKAAPTRTRFPQPAAASSSSGASQSGHIRALGDVPNEAQVPAASKAHASNRKNNAARRSSGSRVRRRKSGPRKSS